MNPASFGFKVSNQNSQKPNSSEQKAGAAPKSAFPSNTAAPAKVSFASLFGKPSGASTNESSNNPSVSAPSVPSSIPPFSKERGDFPSLASRLNVPKSAFSAPPKKRTGPPVPDRPPSQLPDRSQFRLNNKEGPSLASVQNPRMKFIGKNAADGDSNPFARHTSKPPPPYSSSNSNPFDASRYRFKAIQREETPEPSNPFESSSNATKQIRPAKQAPLFASITRKPPGSDSPGRPATGRPDDQSSSLSGSDESDYGKLHTPVQFTSAFAVPRPEFSAEKMFGIELASQKPLAKIADTASRFEDNTAPTSGVNKPEKISDAKSWRQVQKPFQPRKMFSKTRDSSAPRGNSEEQQYLSQLRSLIGRECPTEYDKYTTLEERDKTIYKLRSIDSACIKSLERCEEMCTEKERYMRIVQKRASPFECDEETYEVLHEMMVKEYARSAADQERPLVHELRSEKMMNHTMSYLLHNILDNFPDTVEERASWFNFLWSRTRAIRKEVTQLSMSDTLALNLVERCTRLHILFGYILCTLEVDHFDQKMNNENLGKCLQTLRHLYEDFERRGIDCENEAEFRSYDVLLHVNDTNVLAQVLSYRSEVRQSKHVCLALQLASSVQNNNYTRFFRLLKQDATFLQCCVSHKTFNQMRSNAVSVMTMSYGRNAAYPIEKLTHTLAFDTIEDAKTALGLFGIRSDLEADQVVLNRDFLDLTALVPMQPYKWIDAKRSGNFSQVVYGSEKFHFFASRCDVSNSFDVNNKYVHDKVVEAILSSSSGFDTGKPSNPFALSSSQPASMQMTIDLKRKQDEERIKRVELKKRDDLVVKLMNSLLDRKTMAICHEEKMKDSLTRRQKHAEDQARKKREEIERKQREAEMKRKEQQEALTKRMAENIEKQATERLLETFVQEEICKERKLREQSIAKKLMENMWQKTMLKAIDNHLFNMCLQLIEEKKMVRRGLEEFRKKVARRWIQQFWNRWRSYAVVKKEARLKRQSMLRNCAPKWDSKENETYLVQKYVNEEISPSKIPNNLRNAVRLSALQKRRRHRISRDAIRKWRAFAVEKRTLKSIAKSMGKQESVFFERFKKGEKIKQQFIFEKPEEIGESLFKKHRSFPPQVLDHSTYLEETKIRKPLRACQSFSVLNSFEPLNQDRSSVYAAHEQLDKHGWKGIPGMPAELKEKLKRRRESLEAEKKNHEQKRNRQEEVMIGDARERTSKMDELTNTVDDLLEETRKFTEEMQQMMNELKSRKVEDL